MVTPYSQTNKNELVSPRAVPQLPYFDTPTKYNAPFYLTRQQLPDRHQLKPRSITINHLPNHHNHHQQSTNQLLPPPSPTNHNKYSYQLIVERAREGDQEPIVPLISSDQFLNIK